LLLISASAATQFSLLIFESIETQFSLPIFDRQRRSFRCQFLNRQRRSICFFLKKIINLRSWEGGVKPVLDRPKQG
jgi:hypothetical protein